MYTRGMAQLLSLVCQRSANPDFCLPTRYYLEEFDAMLLKSGDGVAMNLLAILPADTATSETEKLLYYPDPFLSKMCESVWQSGAQGYQLNPDFKTLARRTSQLLVKCWIDGINSVGGEDSRYP